MMWSFYLGVFCPLFMLLHLSVASNEKYKFSWKSQNLWDHQSRLEPHIQKEKYKKHKNYNWQHLKYNQSQHMRRNNRVQNHVEKTHRQSMTTIMKSNEDMFDSLIIPPTTTTSLLRSSDINMTEEKKIHLKAHVKHTNRLIQQVLQNPTLIWVHIPKTGSTFCLSLARAKCPLDFNATCHSVATNEVYLKQGCLTLKSLETICSVAMIKDHGPILPQLLHHHHHLHSDFDDNPSLNQFNFAKNKKKFVMMMREPKSRVISMFADCHHIVGLHNHTLSLEIKSKMYNYSFQQCKNIRRSKPQHKTCVETNSFHILIKYYPHIISGCVVKTLIGSYCNDNIQLTSFDYMKAKTILQEFFYFIGIFEKWKESISKFHKLHHDNDKICELELGQNRNHPFENNEIILALEKVAIDYFDIFDDALYVEAQQIFNNYP